MRRKFEAVAICGLLALLAGCGGGGDASLGGGGGPTPTPAVVELGTGSGSAFQQGVLGIVTPSLQADGSTLVLAALQYSDGTPYTDSAAITFTSSCYGKGLAAFMVGSKTTNTVTTTTGQAEITYMAQGCSGADTITATATINGDILTATGTVTVASNKLSLGSGSGSSFQEGVLGIVTPGLPAGGSTDVLAALQYTDGTLYTTPATVAFTSPCYLKGLAGFAVNGVVTNQVTTTTGQVKISYTAKGCSGADTITATTVVNNNVLHATGDVTVASAPVLFGSGDGSSFQVGVLAIGSPQLSAGGSSSVSATLQYSDGRSYIGSATVTFTSPCYQNGLATFVSGGQATNVITTTTGQVDIAYTAQGCSGTDTITATTVINGNALTATGDITVAPAAVGSIRFISAFPDIISLKGTGGPQTSIVTFEADDSSGDPVPGAHVNFSPNTTVGGITLAPAIATTGADGRVQTVVQAGTQHTTVRVTASATVAGGEAISTQSSGVVIGTGLATQKHFSLSLDTHNLEGYGVDGVTDSVQVILSDRFGNPVPDGTQIAFTTNGGQIQPSCTTAGGTGACSVTWTSANPRPPVAQSASDPLSVIGHAEILAYATGEESFTDVNGDGIFDQGDQFSLYPQFPNSRDNFFGSPPLQDDIGEIYLDQAQIGHYVPGDYFFDFNHNGVRDVPSGKFNGNGCEPANNPPVPCGSSTFGVGLQACIVMTTSQVQIIADPANPDPLRPGDTAVFYVTDLNGNVPPAGMTFSISADGPTVSLQQTAVPDVPGCPAPPVAYPITVRVSATSQSGSFQIVATSPETGTLSYSDTFPVEAP